MKHRIRRLCREDALRPCQQLLDIGLLDLLAQLHIGLAKFALHQAQQDLGFALTLALLDAEFDALLTALLNITIDKGLHDRISR